MSRDGSSVLLEMRGAGEVKLANYRAGRLGLGIGPEDTEPQREQL